jgi:hypothetical protein
LSRRAGRAVVARLLGRKPCGLAAKLATIHLASPGESAATSAAL